MSSPGKILLRNFLQYGMSFQIDEAIQSASTEELREALVWVNEMEFEKLRSLKVPEKMEAVLKARGAHTADQRHHQMEKERFEDRRLSRLALGVAIASGVIALGSLIAAVIALLK